MAAKIPIPPSLVEDIRSSVVAEDLELTDEAISLIAGLLFHYQNSEAAKSLARESQTVKHQNSLLAAANSARETSVKLAKVMADPVLFTRQLNAYKDMKPVTVPYFMRGAQHLDLYLGEATPPADTESALLEIRAQLTLLETALKSIETTPSPNKTNKKTEEALFHLINNLSNVVSQFCTCDKRTTASHIRDLLRLVDIKKSLKTIQNYLS